MGKATADDRLQLTQVISGVVNGEELHGSGKGFAIVRDGELKADFVFTAIPCDFDLLILGCFIFTGFLRVSRCISDVVNPFSEAQPLQFTRTVRFDATTALSARVEYTPKATGVRGKFVFSGTAPQVALESVEPMVETWIASPRQNAIIGRFVMCWRKKDGGLLCGEANSEYVLEGVEDFHPRFRFITIQAKAEGNTLRQEEEISLFESIPGHQPTLVKLKE